MNRKTILFAIKKLVGKLMPRMTRAKSEVANIEKHIHRFRTDLSRHGLACASDLSTLHHYQRYLLTANLSFFGLSQRKSKKKILSVEYNIGHDVIRPSIYHYFSILGYEVDFLLAEYDENKRWNFFERFSCLNQRTVTGSYLFLDAVLTASALEYDFIVFNTSFIFMENHMNCGMDCLDSVFANTGIMPRPKYGFLAIPPHLSALNPDTIKAKSINGITILSHLGYKGLPMLSPHHFGEVNITEKSSRNIFLATGNILPHQKNHSLLLSASEKLVSDGIEDFEVVVNGGYGAIDIPQSLRSKIKIAGDNRPIELFKLIEECDFIVALLDSTNDWQKSQYGQGTCSTGFMYSMGFAKPYIVEDYFLNSIGINDSSVLSYEGQDLYSAMKRAIFMDPSDYSAIQSKILEEGRARHKKSLYDISQQLRKAESPGLDLDSSSIL